MKDKIIKKWITAGQYFSLTPYYQWFDPHYMKRF
jgi:hypothetical protein